MRKIKPCPVCGSKKLKYVYYAPPEKYAPSFWKYDDDGYYPLIWFKRIECKDCGATVPTLVMTIDDAIDYWNAIKDDETGERYVLQRLKSEDFEVQ